MVSEQHKTGKSGIGGWLFLVIVFLIYGVMALVNFELASVTIADFTKLLDKMLPALVIVFILIFIINLLLEPGLVKKYLGRQSGIKGWLTAIVGGILSVGPIYTWYALLRDLRQKGMKTSLAAVFLYSRAVKLPLLPLLVHYFGVNYTLVLVCYLIAFSVISGLVMERIQSVHTEVELGEKD